MGGIVHKDRRGTVNLGHDSPNAEYLNKYDKDTLAAVKNVKDGPTTNIELTISCSNLPKFDFLSQTDARVYCFLEKDGKYEECGKTEVVPNDPNPKFKTKLKVPYNFEKNQIIKFEVYDVDEFREDESDKKEFIGQVTIPLHEIVCAHNQTLTKDIIEFKNRKNKQSTITIRGAEFDESSSKIFFIIGARSFFSKNELSLHLSVVEGQDITFLGKCEHIQNSKGGFDWPEFSIPSNSFPDERSIVKFEVYERTKQKPKNLIGSAEVSLGSMVGYPGKVIKIMKEGFTVGELKLKECKKQTEYTFLNYVYGGAEISLIIALDFTNSNKDPTDEKSLHFISEDYDNEYLQALQTIGDVLQHYDSDKKIPLFGFGAKLPPQYNTVSHCFSMNKNYFDPEVNGLAEVLQVYKDSLKSYKFHGPTIFSEILKMAVDYANYEKNEQLSQKYIILLIITDGDINDMQATMDQIVKAQELPLSVLIVGVGDNEFSEMKVLDGDDATGPIISSDGVKCERDIVQFVPFSKFKNNYEALARETLEEIPKQFLEYMKKNNIEPVINKNNGIKNHDYIKKSQAEAKKKEAKSDSQIPSFLQHAREEFTQKLIKLEMDPELIEEILNEGIPAPDVGLFIELASEKKKKNEPIPEVEAIKEDLLNGSVLEKVESKKDIDEEEPPKVIKMKTRQIVLNKERNIDAEKSKAKEESYKITQKLLEDRDREYLQRKIQALGIEYVQKNEAAKSEPVTLKKRKVFSEYQDHNEHFKALTRDTTPISVEDNICLSCRENVINTVFMPCGHAALCQNCLEAKATNNCIICKQKTQYFMTTKTS